MKTTLAIAAVIIITIGGTGACSTNTPAGNANAVNASANTANQAPANNATPAAPQAAYGSLATPAETYKTAFASRGKGDIAVLKTVFSKDILEFFEMMAEEEKKTLDDMLKGLVKEPQGPNDDVRNEKITGDTATLEYRKDETTWKTMDFIKEGNDWKMTIPRDGAKNKDGKKPE